MFLTSPLWPRYCKPAIGRFSNNNGPELSINGQRARWNNYQLDGQNNNDNTIGGPPIFFGNQDTIAELQVVQDFDAEYGGNVGGVVNYIPKAGTSAFHGTGYEFWQDDHFLISPESRKRPCSGSSPPESRDGVHGTSRAPVRPELVRRHDRRAHQASKMGWNLGPFRAAPVRIAEGRECSR